MLSYQHCFHAGNHADVIKHLCWMAVIDYLNIKAKPYTLIDTHAGEGVYALDDVRNKERQTGVDKLRAPASTTSLLDAYLDIVNHFHKLGNLPGSPAIAAARLRPEDRLLLLERHPTAFANLKRWGAQHAQDNLTMHQRDAFEGLVALSPPIHKRGAVLIDPPYEQIDEYVWVCNAVEKSSKRWPQATCLIWYPLLGERAKSKAIACKQMIEDLLQIAEKTKRGFCQFELCYTSAEKHPGMYGSGVFVINPPWTFEDTMTETLTALTPELGEHASWCTQSE